VIVVATAWGVGVGDGDSMCTEKKESNPKLSMLLLLLCCCDGGIVAPDEIVTLRPQSFNCTSKTVHRLYNPQNTRTIFCSCVSDCI